MRIAAITAVYNEEDLIGQYLDHYGPEVDRVFLLDNGSTDRTLEIAKDRASVEISAFPWLKYDFNPPKHDATMAARKRAVGAFDIVLLVDIDELIVPCAGGRIRDTLEKLPRTDVYRCKGFMMCPGPGETAYDPGRPLLEQRRWGYPDPLYSKPAIVRPESSAIFHLGIHQVTNIRKDQMSSGEFLLLHYMAPDEDIFVRRRMKNELRNLEPQARRTDASWRETFRSLARHQLFGRVLP